MGARSRCEEEVSGTLHRLVRLNFGDEIPVRGRECNTGILIYVLLYSGKDFWGPCFFFWIIKNLFPKGQSPQTTNTSSQGHHINEQTDNTSPITIGKGASARNKNQQMPTGKPI